jgi:protease-4
VTALRKAFEADNAKGIILRINSPGGSPVQSGYVKRRDPRLREKYPDKKVYAVASTSAPPAPTTSPPPPTRSMSTRPR